MICLQKKLIIASNYNPWTGMKVQVFKDCYKGIESWCWKGAYKM